MANITQTKRQIGMSLKKAGFQRSQRVGVVTRLYGAFSMDSGGFHMVKQAPDGKEEHIIFIGSSNYQVLEIVGNNRELFTHYDRWKAQEKEGLDMIHNYLGDENQVAIIKGIKVTKEDKQALIEKIYSHLKGEGFDVEMKDEFLGTQIVING